MTSGPGGPDTLAATLIATAVDTAGVLPISLTGAMAIQLRSAIGLDTEGLGLVFAAFTAAAVLSAPVGRLTERVDPAVFLRGGCALHVVALLGMSLVGSVPGLLILVVASGIATSLTRTTSSVLVARAIPTGHQGLAFGVRNCAIPVAALLSGLAVPAVALTVGWRWAFVIAAGLSAAVLVALPRSIPPAARPGRWTCRCCRCWAWQSPRRWPARLLPHSGRGKRRDPHRHRQHRRHGKPDRGGMVDRPTTRESARRGDRDDGDRRGRLRADVGGCGAAGMAGSAGRLRHRLGLLRLVLLVRHPAQPGRARPGRGRGTVRGVHWFDRGADRSRDDGTPLVVHGGLGGGGCGGAAGRGDHRSGRVEHESEQAASVTGDRLPRPVTPRRRARPRISAQPPPRRGTH
ncbi:MAG: MFS transporter [Chloroflexi bacterium]|nr:MFS transporter [Chloroflexota bacterium]